MPETYDTQEQKERVVLLAVDTDNGEDVYASLDELEELSQTAGAQVVGRMVQNRETIHPGTYIGKGKVDELLQLIQECLSLFSRSQK